VTAAEAAAFDEHLAAWRAWQAAPWGRLRYAVVAHVLARHLADLGEGLRILDIGGGDGVESVELAGQGHSVTLVDYSEVMLDVAQASAAAAGVSVTTVRGDVTALEPLALSGFDVALCHFVIQYVADPAAAVRAVASCVRPGGLISLIAPNAASEVLAKAVRELDFTAAAQLLAARTSYAKTFEQPVARISADAASGYLESAGCQVIGRYGARIVMDLIATDSVKYNPQTYAEIERLELDLCGTAPYRDVGRSWQLVASRSAPTGR
jgi:S-adenosylmethionine-dependent methyltransferase